MTMIRLLIRVLLVAVIAAASASRAVLFALTADAVPGRHEALVLLRHST